MYLARGGPGVVGMFYRTTDWTPFLLGGQWKENSKFELRVTQEEGPPLGSITASLRSAHLTGAWAQTDKSSTPINLQVVHQPACDDIGPLRKFTDPAWPATFSYPANWRLQIGESITLTCPDPAAMAYGMAKIQISKVADLRQDSVLKCGNTWEYGDSCAECQNTTPGMICEPFKVTTQKGLTILNADHREFRTQCLGGGVTAQADGASRYVKLKTTWLNIVGPNPAIVQLITNSLAPNH